MFNPMRILDTIGPISREAAYTLVDLARYLNDTINSLRADVTGLKKLTGDGEPEDLGTVDMGGLEIDVSGQEMTGSIEVKKHSFLYEMRWRYAGETNWRTVLQSHNRFTVPRTKEIEAEIRYLPTPLGRWSKWVSFNIPATLPEETGIVLNNDDLTIEGSPGQNILTWPNTVFQPGHTYEWKIFKGSSTDDEQEPDDAVLSEIARIKATVLDLAYNQEDIEPNLTFTDTNMIKYNFAKYKVALFMDGVEVAAYTAWPVSMNPNEYFYLEYTPRLSGYFDVINTCDELTGWVITGGSALLTTFTKAEGLASIALKPSTAGGVVTFRYPYTYTVSQPTDISFYFLAGGTGQLSSLKLELLDAGLNVVFTSPPISCSNTSWEMKSVTLPNLSFNYIRFSLDWASGKDKYCHIDYVTIAGASLPPLLWFYGNGGYGELYPKHPVFSKWLLPCPVVDLVETYDVNKTWTVGNQEVWMIKQYFMTASTNTLVADGVTIASGAVSGTPLYEVGPGRTITYTRGTGGGRIQIAMSKAYLPPHVTFKRVGVTTTVGFPTQTHEHFFLVGAASGACQMDFGGIKRQIGTPQAGFFTTGNNPIYAYSGTVYLRGYVINGL